MKMKPLNIALVLIIVITVLGGGFIALQNNMKQQAELASQKAAEAQAELKALEAGKIAKAKEAVLNKEFENFLNSFIQQIQKNAKEYKENRKVMSGLIEPENLTQPDYIAENVKLARASVVDLESQMSRILSIFGVADVQVRSLIAKFSLEGQKNVEESWDKAKTENSNIFMAYFASEQDILKAELALMEFYNAHRDVLKLDEQAERIIFEDNIELQQQEAFLRGHIIKLKAAQKDMMKAPELNEEPVEEAVE